MTRELLSAALESVRDEYIQEAGAPRRRKRPVLRRAAVIAAAAVLCLALALPALAASEGGYELLYRLAPAVAQYFKPVQMSCEDQGIEMEVLSVYVHGDTAEAYVSLRDIAGDRVDETTDLFDSYGVNLPFNNSATCRMESYDPDNHAAMFYVAISRDDHLPIRGEKLTFYLRGFLSRRSQQGGPLPQSLLTEAEAEPAVMAVGYDSAYRSLGTLRGGGGEHFPAWDNFTCLAPLPKPLYAPMDHVTITGAGYIDGQLHIQTHLAQIHDTDTHGYVYLLADDGTRIDSDYAVAFWDEDGTGSYEDHVFSVSPSEAEDCTLWGLFWTSGLHIQGSWEVTFPLEAE